MTLVAICVAIPHYMHHCGDVAPQT